MEMWLTVGCLRLMSLRGTTALVWMAVGSSPASDPQQSLRTEWAIMTQLGVWFGALSALSESL